MSTANKPQDHEAADDDDSATEIEDDLKILADMKIDQDFNVWSDFRNSIAVRGKRDSLESTFSGRSIGNTGHSDSGASTTPVVLGLQNKLQQSERSIFENDHLGESTGRESIGSSELSVSDHNQHQPCLDVSFCTLTQGEIRDLRAWNLRIARDTVFSRYYFPEQWESRELKTIEKFLELEDPHECPWFMNEIGQERTKKTLTDIFYPGDHDAKSVLLKRGPVLLDGMAERELLLFTHGFILSKMEFSALLHILFTINSEHPEFLSPKQLRDRFNAIDSDQSGSLDRCELKEMFKGMGVPIGEIALTDIMDRFDEDQDGTIDFEEFERVMHELEPKKEERWSWGGLNSLGSKFKKTLSRSLTSTVERKVDCGFPLSDIIKVESINICSSESTKMFANSSWTELIFAIYVKERDEPLIMVCSKPEQRLAWVDAFRTCCVKSLQLRASNGSKTAKKIQRIVGWQHILIQASIFSLVVCNDLSGLEQQLASPSLDSDINDPDEYSQRTALHYAVILDRIECAKVLLKHKAKVNLQDIDQKTALDHASLLENKGMIKLLERHGAKKHTSEVLFKSAVEEQKLLKSEQQSPKPAGNKMFAKAKEATGAMSQAMQAMTERGEKLEGLDNKTAQLQSGASNYAEMAKQLKEKNKKKANFLGI